MTSPTITATFGTLPVETKAAPAISGVASPESWLLDWGGLPTVAGPAVTPASAMGVPAVASAVCLISGAIGSLPVKVFKAADKGGRDEAADHPAFALVHDDANDFQDAGQLRAQLVTDALLKGNGYGIVRRDAAGSPVAIWRAPPEAVSIEVDQLTGAPFFRLAVLGGHEIISPADMIHVPNPGSIDGISGTATIVRARNVISLAIALEHHAARILRNGARPSGVLTAPLVKSVDGARKVQESFGHLHANENSGGAAVVYGGMTFTPLEFKSVDQQFLEQRAFQVHEIAKAFNVPPTMIGELSKATLSNSETMGQQFLTLTLMPWITSIQAAYRRTLISHEDRRTYAVEFVTDGLLRADSAARAAFYASMRASGNMTANEVRRLENLPDHPDGNALTSPHITAAIAPAPEPSLA